MLKKILCVITAVALLGLTGCELISKATETTTTTAPASVRIVREAKIGHTLLMKQMEINLETEVKIILSLKDGDSMEGYFYLLKGDKVGVTISGISTLYSFTTVESGDTTVTSDMFSFTANQGQGVAYTMTLTAGTDTEGKKKEATVFLEIIYPATGSLFVPIGTK
jgi:hypothetical protein